MKTKKIKGNNKKLDKMENFKKHFGWKTESRQDGLLIMKFDKKIKHASELKKLEKQAKVLNSKFPKRMIGWAIFGALFLCSYFFLDFGNAFKTFGLYDALALDENNLLRFLFIDVLPIIFLIFGAIDSFFAVYELIVFIVLKVIKRKTIETIIKLADSLSGNIVDAPLQDNVFPTGPNTGVLAGVNIGSNYRDE